MTKTEVYSWRLDPDLKQRLEQAARAERTSVGGLLERMARDWLSKVSREQDDEAVQRRLRAEAEKWIGSISLGEGPYTRERIRARVRANLAGKQKRRHAPTGSD
jgi:hypothetical protein